MSDSISQDLFDLLVSKDFEVKSFDSNGKPVLDVNDANIFRFDFTVGKNNYGTAVILIDDEANFELFFGDNIGKTMRGKDKNYWFDFLHTLKQFSIRHLKKFKPSNMNKMKYSMQGIAAIKEGLFESKWSGTSKTSYNKQPKKVRIIAKHNKRLGEDDARFRNIKTLFIENGDGERFKLPFVNIGGARAMARHVSEGGNPYDQFGVHISETVKDIATMGGFLRIRSLNEQEGEISKIRENCRDYYKGLRGKLKSLSSKRGYKKYFESWEPTQIEENEATINALRNVFIQDDVNEKIENALPLISRLQQMSEGDVIHHNFKSKRTSKSSDENAEIVTPEIKSNKTYSDYFASQIPKYDPKTKRPYTSDQVGDDIEWGFMEEFLEFDLKPLPGNKAQVVGITQGGERILLTKDSYEEHIAEKVVDAFNSGGWVDKPPQKESKDNMKQLREFEDWADDIAEASLTNTPFATEQLAEKFKEPIPVGVNALNVQEIVDELVGEEDLMQQLSDVAEGDPEADARPIIVDWLYENGYDFIADRLDYEPEQDVAGGDQVDDLINDVEADEAGMQEDIVDETWGSERGPDGEPSINDWLTSPIDSFKERTNIRQKKYNDEMNTLRQQAGDSPEAKEAEFGCLGDPRDCLKDFNKQKSVGEDAEMNDMLKLAGINEQSNVQEMTDINPKANAAKEFHEDKLG